VSQSLRHIGEEEAAGWFAKRRRGMMTLEEHAAYEAWRRHPANAAAMAEFERVWSVLDGAGGYSNPMPEPAMHHRALFRRSALLAVMCLVSLGLGVVSYSGDSGFWTELDWVER